MENHEQQNQRPSYSDVGRSYAEVSQTTRRLVNKDHNDLFVIIIRPRSLGASCFENHNLKDAF